MEELWKTRGLQRSRSVFLFNFGVVATTATALGLWKTWGDRLTTAAPSCLFLLAVMTITRDDARAIFDQAVEHTRGLSPATFDQWFGGVQFDDLTDGVLTLRVQNEFVLEWVKANFLPTLTEKIRALSGWSVQVAWTVDPHLAMPVSSRSLIQPVRPRAIALRPLSLRPSRWRRKARRDRRRRPARRDRKQPRTPAQRAAPRRSRAALKTSRRRRPWCGAASLARVGGDDDHAEERRPRGGEALRTRLLAPPDDRRGDPPGLRRRRVVPERPRSTLGGDVHDDVQHLRTAPGRSPAASASSSSMSADDPARCARISSQ